jgi:integrase
MARNAPLRVWDIHDNYGRPLRLYRPTASCRYLSTTWYEPGVERQQRTTLGTDLEEAVAWCETEVERLRRAQRRRRPDRPRALGQVLCEEYLNLDNQPGWDSPATVAKQTNLVKVFVPARLRNLPCEHWSTEDLRQIVLTASQQGYARSYLASLKAMLSGLVRLGVELGYFDPDQLTPSAVRVPRTGARSPAQPIRGVLPSVDLDDDDDDGELLSPVFRHQLPTIDRIHALAEALPEPYRTMALLAAYSGMRWGELAALRYTDVDPAARIVHVRWAALETSGGKLYLRKPKNRRRRTTLYPALIADDITTAWTEAKSRAAQGGSDLMYPSPTGLVLRRSNFGRRQFRPRVRLPDGRLSGASTRFVTVLRSGCSTTEASHSMTSPTCSATVTSR